MPPAADESAERMTDKGPIDPPYPSVWEVEGRSGRWIVGLTVWFAGVAAWLLGYEWRAAILLAPGLAWLIRACVRSRSLRARALEGLRVRAPGLTRSERERELKTIFTTYGAVGRRGPVEEIRAVPEPPSSR